MDKFTQQLIYKVDNNIVINDLSYLNKADEVLALRKCEKKFSKYGYIKPYSLKCVSKKDYAEFTFSQFTSKLKKQYVCEGLVHYPRPTDIYKATIEIIQDNCGIKCVISDILNKKTQEEVIILSLIIPITNVNIEEYKVGDIVFVKVIDIKYENNSEELFAIGNIIDEEEIDNIRNMKPIINNIMENYIDNTYIIKPELLERIKIINNHLNIIYPIKYSNNKLVFSIYEFLTNLNDNIDCDDYKELYVKYIYIKYDVNITDELLYIDNKMETFEDIMEIMDCDTNSERYCGYSDDDYNDDDDDDDNDDDNDDNEDYDDYDYDDNNQNEEKEEKEEEEEEDEEDEDLDNIEDFEEIDKIVKKIENNNSKITEIEI